MEQYTPSQQEVDSGKVYAILAYIGILVLVPILAAKDNNYARYHANQGLVLLIANVLLGVIGMIPIVGLISMLGFLVTFIFMIVGIINAVKGVAKPLPLIGGITILK